MEDIPIASPASRRMGVEPGGWRVTAVTRPAGRLAAYTYQEYRRFEDTNPARHEYVDGQILAMAGGTHAHARLQAAVLFALERRLESRPCQLTREL